ncbi:AMP-binding protein [Komagataeibacter oboediens]|uniref:AMP-binding protein n=1 Tax=Komagataeibacter oboediens TaxID=65958 RepID=UPI001C2D5A08|nr:AMP-binding protein [Komagataeibacter oboediens]MBV1825000.1 AMP-binding protein [Komagataeibacter oboediens]
MTSHFHDDYATLSAPPVRACIPRVTGRMARQPAPMPFGQGRRMLNLSALCVDRHLGDHADRAAITGPEIVSYRSLHERVCRLANALNDQGVRRGDTVAVTLPPGVDGIVAVLACMRIGAVHVLLAGGLDAPAMAAGLSECCAVAVIAGGNAGHDTTQAGLKSMLDRALAMAGSRSRVRMVLVAAPADAPLPMQAGRDHRYDAVVDWYEPDCPPETTCADDPLFMLYRAGGAHGSVHTVAEYGRLVSYTMDMLSPRGDGALPYGMIDMAWQTGQSALVIGVLTQGGTVCLS